ncbi:MAG: hypothetical protein ACJ72N_28765 [Labedaea sp.]
MRNRVAHSGVHAVRRWAVRAVGGAATLAVLPTVLVIAVAAPAAADTVGSAAAERWSFGLVGVAAVLFGLGGVVIGLFRRRRVRAMAAMLDTRPMAPIVADPARTESAF